jgi:hypothetical protein
MRCLTRTSDKATAGAQVRARAAARWCPALGLCAALLLCCALLLAPGALAGAKTKRHPRAEPNLPAFTVAADQAHPRAAVPQDFLGLSFELSALSLVAGYSERGNLVTLLRSLGTGVMRFGGVSADTRTAWTDSQTPRPEWASNVIDRSDLHRLGALAARSGWRVVLTIGLVHYDPVAAAREVAAAKAELGEWLEAIELGNEPNAYGSHDQREPSWEFVQYNAQVAAYRSAIEAAAPGIPLYGPDVSGSGAFEAWGLGEAINQRPAILTGHHYPLGCKQLISPTIERLLSPLIRRKEDKSLRRYMSVALASATPFRLDEANTVSCGGTAGISNTFASALWATAYLPSVMAAGVVGINLQGNMSNCNGYAPLCAPTPEAIAAGALGAQPEWYALLLAKSLLGSRPLPTTLGNPQRRNVEASAFLAADGRLQFVLVDDDPPGARKLTVTLRVGNAFSRASVLALTAPSPTALSGVLLGGAPVSPAGTWTAARLPQAAVKRGVVRLHIAPSSAALVSVSRAGG